MKAPPPPIEGQAPSVCMSVPQLIKLKYLKALSESQIYFIHILTTKAIRHEKPLHAFHPLQLSLLVKQLGSKPRERQIQNLIHLGLVEVQLNVFGMETYEKGVRPKSYRLSPELLSEIKEDMISVVYSKQGSALSKRIFKLRQDQKNEAIKSEPLLKREFEWLKRLGFDLNKAYDFQFQFEQTGRRGSKHYGRGAAMRWKSDLEILNQLSSGDFTFTYNGIRLTTSVCNAMKEMRYCLIDSEGIGFSELDLRSSQLVFLCKALYLKYINNIQEDLSAVLSKFASAHVNLQNLDVVVPSDVRAFINLVIYGDIYTELFIDESMFEDKWFETLEGYSYKGFAIVSNRIPKAIRDDFKQAIMKEVLFNYYSRKKVFPRVYMAFKESFPNVADFIEQFAIESHDWKKSRDISLLLQQYEARFFHFEALDILQANFPQREFYVVHDSIGVPLDIEAECHHLLTECASKFLGVPVTASLFKAE